MTVRAILFDLDGTFADTAADLGLALNRLRAEHGLDALPLSAVRPHASAGARGLLAAGFGVSPEDDRYAALRERFLDLYEQNLCVETRLFNGIPELIAALEARALPWGIVTNKAERFARPLLAALGLDGRPHCVVGSDSVPRIKPAPDPLLRASSLLELPAARCLYVGDDLRDLQAARAAGMRFVAAGWGYLGAGTDPHAWGADAVIASPLELLHLLEDPRPRASPKIPL